MKKELIVSYYNSLDFCELTQKLNDDIKVTVYNKSGKKLGNYDNEILLENIGREGHTYLNHIISNYDNLTDLSIFIQDDFNEHLPSIDFFQESLKQNEESGFYLFPCSWRRSDYVSQYRRGVVDGYLELAEITDKYAIKHFSERFEILLPSSYQTEVCAHFLVSKEKILKHSKEKYEKILEWLLEHENNGYVLEHSWKIIFG